MDQERFRYIFVAAVRHSKRRDSGWVYEMAQRIADSTPLPINELECADQLRSATAQIAEFAASDEPPSKVDRREQAKPSG